MIRTPLGHRASSARSERFDRESCNGDIAGSIDSKMLGFRSDSLERLFLNETILGETTYLAAGMPRQPVAEEALQIIHRFLAVGRLRMHDVPEHTEEAVQRCDEPRRGVRPAHVLAVQELPEKRREPMRGRAFTDERSRQTAAERRRLRPETRREFE
jgi:hypothetical protein